MESRANHILIGSFVLLGIAGIFAFVVWKAKIDIGGKPAYYDIHFEESVTGLPLGGEVRYRGIKIGTVVDIAVEPDNPELVVVRIETDGKTALREGDTATLKLLGITGITFINIEGATADSKPLTAAAGQELPVIPSQRSEVEQLVQGAPELLNQGTLLATRLSDLFNAENRALVNDILRDVNQLTSAVAASGENIERIISAVEQSTRELAGTAVVVRDVATKINDLLDDATDTLASTRATVSDARRAVGKVDTMLERDVTKLIADLRHTAASFDQVAGEVNEILSDNRESIAEFTSDGLNELIRFIGEARLLVAGISRVADRVEAQGARFLFDNKQSDFKAD